MNTSENFYSNLKPFDQFRGISDSGNFARLPLDWLVVIVDVQNSTAAIQDGHYRQVNAVGAASIAAVINAVKHLEVPYIFGGDGASFCIPESRLQEVRNALAATQLMAKKQFDLSLRAGIVPCSILQQSGRSVLIGKFQVSKDYIQAAFAGEGLTYAEKLIKDDTQGIYCIDARHVDPKADFDGFECRWKDIPTPLGETLTLLVEATSDSIDEASLIYREVLDEIQKHYGEIETHRPLQKEYLRLTTESNELKDEVKIIAGSRNLFGRLLYAWSLPWKVRLGRYWMKSGKHALNTDWGTYKDALVANSDFRKFDDKLRMVISGNSQQRKNLIGYLERQYLKGLLVYGHHVSTKALMTCVIFDYNKDHVHFIDGSEGGYTMAAKAMKKRLKKRENETT